MVLPLSGLSISQNTFPSQSPKSHFVIVSLLSSGLDQISTCFLFLLFKNSIRYIQIAKSNLELFYQIQTLEQK